MKHATTPSSSSRPLDSAKNGLALAGAKARTDHVVNSIEGSGSTSTATTSNTNGHKSSATAQNGVKAANGDDRNDSEADTEIESGKEDGPRASSRKFKHNGSRRDASAQNGHARRNGEIRKSSDAEADKPPNSASVKDAENSNSSILTSAVSSPSNEQYSRPGSETAPQSPSKTSVDSDTTKNGKRKRDTDDPDASTKQRKVKREDSLTGSPTRIRSGSPPTRRKRTLSTQSTSTPVQQNAQSRGRRKPPPIHTKSIHDNDSEDSSTSHPQSHHRKSASLQHSSRRMPAGVNTARYRDRNGRTFLAKACAGSDVEAVRERFLENPDHLDVKEYAENSPLQIASLEGREEIVKFLVDQGANVNTQNDARDTPLIDAVENGHLGVVRILLDAGANPSQPNAKGEEPLELIPEDGNDTDAIRAILLEAKEKYKFRRPSEPTEQQQAQQQQTQPQNSTKSRSSVPIPSPKGSPSFQQSRFGADTGRSRRAQRGQSNKRDDLLWIPATAARLQQAAGEGDAQATNHILSMGTAVDSESVLAAAKGCHEDCLSLLMAFGTPEVADPDPIPGLKNGWDTPLLATIGQSGDNLNIINILLGQPGFDPTRRLFQDKTYFEIARERAGPHADEEVAILEKAYDEYAKENASPRRKKKQQPQVAPAADSGSPRSARVEKDQQQQQQHRKDASEAKNKHPPSDGKQRRRGSMDRPHSSSNSRLPVLKHKSRESSVAVSDREREPASPSRRDKRRRISSSSEEEDEKVIRKQRRRLLTGKERREGAERKRRSSITSLDTPRSKLQEDAKKPRTSMSPARDNDRKASDPAITQKIKRQRSEQQVQQQASGATKSSKEKLAEKSSQPLPASQKQKSTTSSPPKAAEIKSEPKSDAKADADMEKRGKKREDESVSTAAAVEEKEKHQREQRRKEKERNELEEKRSEERKAEEKRAEERKAEEKRAEERKAEEKRAEERKAEEARKSAAAAAAAAAAAKRAEEEKQQEEERKRKLEAEEAARKKEEAARRAEEERKRQEAEAAAEAARAKEMERQRDQKRLPEAVYAAFHRHQSPPTADELEEWRNLRLVTSDVLVENGVLQRSTATDKADWVLNMQVAVLLGTKSLQLSTHAALASCEKVTLPGKLGLKCSAWWPHTITSMQTSDESYSEYQARVALDRQKMAALARENELFFIRRTVFDEAVHQSPHLQGFQLRPSYFAFARFGSAKDTTTPP